MRAKDAIKLSLKSTQDMLNSYLGDLSDQDLTVRPVPAANNIAWQLGHLISAEQQMLTQLGAKAAPLPAGFDIAYDGKASGSVPPGGYLKKADYLEMFNKLRSATIAHVESMSDADFDKAMTGPTAKWAPTVGALLVLMGNHVLMHAGQFTVVRRALNKPVLF